jgi:hypothetical protein
MELFPTPDAAYTIGINYFKKVTPLSSSVTTNDILDEFPDLYLYGSCLEGALYLNDNEQTQRFLNIFMQTLDNVKESEERSRYSGTVMSMTVQGEPGSLVRRGAY